MKCFCLPIIRRLPQDSGERLISYRIGKYMPLRSNRKQERLLSSHQDRQEYLFLQLEGQCCLQSVMLLQRNLFRKKPGKKSPAVQPGTFFQYYKKPYHSHLNSFSPLTVFVFSVNKCCGCTVFTSSCR